MTDIAGTIDKHGFTLAQYFICLKGIVWREALRFIGVSDVRFVPIGPTTGPLEPIRSAREGAHRRLAETAARF